MKKHLTHFNSKAEFDAAFKSGISSGFNLEGPHVSYIEGTGVRYMKKNDPVFERLRDRKIFEENKTKYFTMTALEDGIQIRCTLYPEVSAIEKMSYSLDEGETWTEFTRSSQDVEIVVPILNTGDTISWKGEFNSSGAQLYEDSENGDKYLVFRFNNENSGYLELSGNLGSLLYGDDFSDYVSTKFKYTSSLLGDIKGYIRSVKYLVLDAGRFNLSSLFSGCQNLLYGPVELPATTLIQNCYYQMFSSCTSLTSAPELPATTLAYGCYRYMFSGCTSLTTAPELPATTLASYCYQGMFSGCRALATAPELPAETLASSCYSYMFRYCSNLQSITMLATNIYAPNCLTSWVEYVSSTGTFTKAASMTTLPTGTSGIPRGWTVEVASS